MVDSPEKVLNDSTRNEKIVETPKRPLMAILRKHSRFHLEKVLSFLTKPRRTSTNRPTPPKHVEKPITPLQRSRLISSKVQLRIKQSIQHYTVLVLARPVVVVLVQ